MKRLLLALAGVLVAAQAAFAGSGATYTVTFEGDWTATNHPREYPANAHFSGLIGATHNGGYSLFREDGIASDGLEKLAETGSHSPLDQEIRKAIEAGTAGALLTSGPLFNLPKSTSITFAVDEKHPMVSLVAMIAPSPDWFAGVADVSLRAGGLWVKHHEVIVYAWDAGTDSGITYQADDADTQPRQPIALNRSHHFTNGKTLLPVGKLVFERKDGTAPRASLK